MRTSVINKVIVIISAVCLLAHFLLALYLPRSGLKIEVIPEEPASTLEYDKDLQDDRMDSRIIRTLMSIYPDNKPLVIIWTGYLYVDTPGEYVFSGESDDLFALHVDGTLVFSNDHLGQLRRNGGNLHLNKGHHRIEMRYERMEGRGWLQTWYQTPPLETKPLYTASLFPETMDPGMRTLKLLDEGFVYTILILLLHFLLNTASERLKIRIQKQGLPPVILHILMVCSIVTVFFTPYSIHVLIVYLTFWLIHWLLLIVRLDPGFRFILSIILIVLFVYLINVTGLVSSNDGSHYALVQSIVEDRSFVINSCMDYTKDVDASIVDGNYYSDRPPGTAFTCIPFYLSGKILRNYLGTRIEYQSYNPVQTDKSSIYTSVLLSVTAGIGSLILIHFLCLKMGISINIAAIIAGLAAFGMMNMKYSTVLYSHALCGMLVLLVLTLFMVIRERKNSGKRYIQYCFLAGLVLGILPSVEYIHLLLVIVCFPYMWLVTGNSTLSRRAYTMTIFLMGFLIPVILLALYNHVCFGDIFSISYKFSRVQWVRASQNFHGNVLEGLTGLLFKPQYKGIFWASPFLIFGMFGAGLFFKKQKQLIVMSFLFFAIILVPVSRHLVFWGGKTQDPRYLFTVAPLLLFPLGFWLHGSGIQNSHRMMKVLSTSIFIGLALYSILFHLATTLSFGRPAGALFLNQLMNFPVSFDVFREVHLRELFPHYRIVPVTYLVLANFLLPCFLFSVRTLTSSGRQTESKKNQ